MKTSVGMQVVYHVKLGDISQKLYAGHFSQKGWDKFISDIANLQAVKYSPIIGEEEYGFITDQVGAGPIVKFLPDIVSRLNCDDPLKNTTGKLCSRRLSECQRPEISMRMDFEPKKSHSSVSAMEPEHD